jgi:hypothetical protein
MNRSAIRFSLMVLALLLAQMLFAKKTPVPEGFNALRIGRPYRDVGHLLKKSNTKIPILSQVAWHYYYYTQGLAIESAALEREQYMLNPEGDYKFYLGVPVQMIYVDFDHNDRISVITLFFSNDLSCKIADAFETQTKEKLPPCNNHRSEAHKIISEDSLHYEYFSNYLIDSVYLGYTVIRFSGGAQTVSDEVMGVKKHSAGKMEYTHDFLGFDVFRIGKSFGELKAYIHRGKGFSYGLLSGSHQFIEYGYRFEPDCWHPFQHYSGWKKYDYIDVITVDLFFDDDNKLKRINVIMRDTPENRDYLKMKLSTQFSSPLIVKNDSFSGQYWQGVWNINKRQVSVSCTYRMPGVSTGPPAVITLSIMEH